MEPDFTTRNFVNNSSKANSPKKYLLIVAFVLLSILIIFIGSRTNASKEIATETEPTHKTISSEKIEVNSDRYDQLQRQIDSCQTIITESKKEQEEIHHENNLLRELFSQGKNQK